VRVDKIKRLWGKDGGECIIGVIGEIEGLGKVKAMQKVTL